jgi:hypothetical protein
MKQKITKSIQNMSFTILVGLLSFTATNVLAQSQQVIGAFPTMDGGFEGQAASGTITAATYATGTQGTVWTGSSAMATFQSATPRTGGKYMNINFTSTTKRFQSPTAAAGAVVNNILNTTGTTTSGSMDITAVGSTTGAVVGMGIAGTGIPSGATITAIGSGTFTISAAATAAGTVAIVVYPSVVYTMQYYYRTTGATNVGGNIQYMGASADGTNPLPTMVYTVLGNIGKGTTAVGSNIITSYVASSPSAISVGGPIGGAGIPAGTTVTAYDATTITMSQNATVAGTGVILSTLPLVGTNNVWAKMSGTVIPSASTNASPQYGYGCFVRTAVAMTAAMDIDDAVMYAGSLDEIAPDAPTAPTALAATTTSMNVSWNAPTTGVDGGGYMVVRSSVADPASVPNVNGIYAVGNTVNDAVGATGTVVYLGSNPAFTDLNLTASTKYYYRIYTVDKAFNYSTALAVNGTTDLGTALSQTQISGVTFDGQIIHNPNNVDLQVFDITGRRVLSSAKDIDMRAGSKGIYVVKSANQTLKIALN